MVPEPIALNNEAHVSKMASERSFHGVLFKLPDFFNRYVLFHVFLPIDYR